MLTIQKNRIKDVLEEQQIFTDQVCAQHDTLLTQNQSLKKLLSQTIDKLIKVNPGLLKDINFASVMNDPCKDYKLIGNVADSEHWKSLASLLTDNVKT